MEAVICRHAQAIRVSGRIRCRSVMPDRAIPQVTGVYRPEYTLQALPEHLLIREAPPDFLHGFSLPIRKNRKHIFRIFVRRMCLLLILDEKSVLEPLKGKTGGFPSYFRLSATATATATVAPTMGLLPMPRKPIISTCAGTEEEPANCASECMRPMVSVMP